MCCWNTNLVDKVTKANEQLFDETASTSSTSLLNTMFQVVWPTLVAPKMIDIMLNKRLDLGVNSNGYTLRISAGILSNLRLQFTHVGVVQTAEATAKPFHERSMHTWTLHDVRTWLGSVLAMTEELTQERLAELGPLLEKNWLHLAVCNAEELETWFKFTKEESQKIISMRSEFTSPDFVGPLAEKIADAARSASSDKDRRDIGNTCSVVSMDVGITLSGATYMEIQLENESCDMHNVEGHVKTITLDAKVRVEIDPTNEEVRIAFFEKPEIDADVAIDVTTLNVPMFGEARWLEEVLERVLEDFSLDNPLTIPLGGADGGRSNEVTKRSVRRAF